jgi:dihydrofolate reductase
MQKLIVFNEYQFVVNPIVLGKGRTMFDGLTQKLALKLIQSHTFANGNMVLCYARTA